MTKSHIYHFRHGRLLHRFFCWWGVNFLHGIYNKRVKHARGGGGGGGGSIHSFQDILKICCSEIISGEFGRLQCPIICDHNGFSFNI